MILKEILFLLWARERQAFVSFVKNLTHPVSLPASAGHHRSSCDKIRTKWGMRASRLCFTGVFSKARPSGVAGSLTRSLKITEVLSPRNIQLLTTMRGASDCAGSVPRLISDRQFPAAASVPHISEKRNPNLASGSALFVIFKQIKWKLICLLRNAVAAKWPGSPTGFCGERHRCALIASIANKQRTNYGPSGIALTRR